MPPYKMNHLCSRLRCWCREFDAKKLSVCLSVVPQHGEMTQTHWRMKWWDLSSVKPFWCCTFPFQSWRITTWGARNIKGEKRRNTEKTWGPWRSDFMKALKKYFNQKWTFWHHPIVSPNLHSLLFFFSVGKQNDECTAHFFHMQLQLMVTRAFKLQKGYISIIKLLWKCSIQVIW